jgi:TldD protein
MDMADLDLVDFAVDYARQKGATYAEARFEHQTNEDFILKNSVLDALYFGEDSGIGVRVLANGGLGFAATNAMTKGDVKAIVDDAVKIAKAAHRKDPISFAPEKPVVTNWSVPQVKKLSDVPVEEKIEEILHIDRELKDLKFKMPARYFQQSNKQIDKYFVNSEGSKIRSFSPRVRLFYFLTVAHNGNVEQTYQNYGWSGGWEALNELQMRRRVIDEAKSMDNSLAHGKKSPEGKMDLVVGPQVSGIAAHESCGHPTEADRVLGREAAQAGKSFITPASIGQRVGSPVVNVCDDPTLEHGIAFYAYDDEGVKARRRYLYKDGIINEFLQNRETAAILGTRSNGSARASAYNVEAIVRMANTFVEPKDWGLEEMISGVKFGVYMKSFMEWNIDDKRFNGKYVGREAYLIENGQVTTPVRKTVIELTTPTFWGAVDAVGKDLEIFHAGFCGKSDPGQALDAALGGASMRLRNVYLR